MVTRWMSAFGQAGTVSQVNVTLVLALRSSSAVETPQPLNVNVCLG